MNEDEISLVKSKLIKKLISTIGNQNEENLIGQTDNPLPITTNLSNAVLDFKSIQIKLIIILIKSLIFKFNLS